MSERLMIEKILRGELEGEFYKSLDWERTQFDKEEDKRRADENWVYDKKIMPGCGYILLSFLTAIGIGVWAFVYNPDNQKQKTKTPVLENVLEEYYGFVENIDDMGAQPLAEGDYVKDGKIYAKRYKMK